jgi:two-component system, chemotaxis family, sensor kinase CheA
MDLRRFLDLYVSETGEHVRLLHRSLLALEKDPDGGAIDGAFRAAHTIKGLSAAMGYGAVADLAHSLEDRLEEIRAGRIQPDAVLIDNMLEGADAVEAAIAAAVSVPPGGAAWGGALPMPGFAAAGVSKTLSPGTVRAMMPADATAVALVRLRADAPIKSARAMIVMRSLSGLAGVLGSEPAEFGDGFGGEFAIFFGSGTNLDEAGSIIAAAGEVESVQFTAPTKLEPAAAASPQAAGRGVAPSVLLPPERQVRVDAERLDALAEGIGELAVLFGRLGPEAQSGAQGEDLGRMATVVAGLQADVLHLRMVPLRTALERLPRVVRDAARSVGREVDLVVAGEEVQLDRRIVSELGDLLVHLLRNAVDHGIEAPDERIRAGKAALGTIRVTAERERSSVCITVADDGRGVARRRVVAMAKAAGLLPAEGQDAVTDAELFRLLSHAGLSTAEQVNAVSGRGVGMDVVVSGIRALGGAIDMRTVEGAGTTFTMRLPVTLAMAQALLVRVGTEKYAIPLTHITEAVELSGSVDDAGGMLRLRGEQVPLVRLASVLGVHGGGSEEAAVIAVRGERRVALAVHEIIGREQILVKELEAAAGTLPYFSGAMLLADGRPALVLDPLSVT